MSEQQKEDSFEEALIEEAKEHGHLSEYEAEKGKEAAREKKEKTGTSLPFLHPELHTEHLLKARGRCANIDPSDAVEEIESVTKQLVSERDREEAHKLLAELKALCERAESGGSSSSLAHVFNVIREQRERFSEALGSAREGQ